MANDQEIMGSLKQKLEKIFEESMRLTVPRSNDPMGLWSKVKGKDTQFRGPQPIGQRFDSDTNFKENAQRAVVSLQAGVQKYRDAWAHICEISRRGYEKVYHRLGVHLEEKDESFYNPYIPRALELLSEKGLIEESEGARVIFIEGKAIPLVVVKRDVLQFVEHVEESCTNLLPNVLCEYLYNLSEHITKFYTNCQVVGSVDETSRLLL